MSQAKYQLETSTNEIMRILDDLRQFHELKQNDEILQLVNSIINEYKTLSTDLELLISNLTSLGRTLENVLPKNPNEKISSNKYSYIDKYRTLKEHSCTPDSINVIAKVDGVDILVRRAILSHLFDFSTDEIDEIIKR